MSAEEHKPEISIVVAMHNAARFLEDSLTSLAEQQEVDHEIIVVDDASTDDSTAVVRRIGERYPVIRLITCQENRGPAAARNEGIRAAHGKFIAIADADDVSRADRCRVQSEYLRRNHDIFLVGSSFRYVDSDSRALHEEHMTQTIEMIATALPKRNIIHNPTVMFRNEGYFYREKFSAAEDYDLWLRLLTDGKKFFVLPDLLVDYRLHASSISASSRDHLLAQVRLAQQFYAERLADGVDTYETATWPILKNGRESGGVALTSAREIKFKFWNGGSGVEIRTAIRSFWTKHGPGMWPVSLLYFLATLIPRRTRQILKDVMF